MKPKLLHIILMLAAMASLSQASFAQDAMQNDNDTTDFGKYKDILLESQKLAQDGNYKAAIEAANKYQSLDLQNRDSIASQELAIQNEKLNNIQRENENSRIAIQNAKLMLEQARQQQELSALQQERSKLMLDTARLNLENIKSVLNQKKIDAQNAKNEISATAAQLEKTKNLSRMRKTVIYAVIAMLIIAIIFLAYFIRGKNRFNRELKAKRDTAIEARNDAQKALAEAEKSDHLKAVFLKNIGSEIKTPLNTITQNTKVLSSGQEIPQEKRSQMVREIQSGSSNLISTISGIMDMAKVETGNYKLQHSSMTMRDLSSSTKNIVKDNAPASLELIIKCRNNDYAIITDGWLLQQMMKYMVKAIVLKYSSGFLDIEFHTMANMVKISVAHVGKYAVDSIFARRGDSGQEYDEASVSVCHKIAGLLKGRCYIDNSHTLGSRIIFEHPASIY